MPVLVRLNCAMPMGLPQLACAVSPRTVVPKLRPDFRVRLAPDQPGHRLALTGQDMQLPHVQSCLQLAHEISRGETLMSVANGRHPAQHPQCRIVSGGIHACSSIEALMLRFRESVS